MLCIFAFIMDSRFIEHRLSELKDRKSKNTFLESIMVDPSSTVIHEVNGHKTILFPGCKGPRTNTWEQTKKMAKELNETGIDVAFLSELDGITCADSILKIGNTFNIVDFKYCVTVSSNTLAKELEHGFEQANTIVLKLRNMDVGQFKEAVDYLLRNKVSCGDIILMNRYGKVMVIGHRDIKNRTYFRKIKGFL